MTRGKADNGKSCGPQLFVRDEPSNGWGLDELNAYAQMQYRQILDGEKLLAPAYWRLGQALALAKRAFKHGKWSQHLKDLGIDKTRASKARAICQTFDKADDVARLTVEEAYAKRQRRQSVEPDESTNCGPQTKKDVQRLRKSVGSVGKRTEDVIHDAAFAAPNEAVILIPAVRKAIRQLEELLDYLEQQAGAAPPDVKAEMAEPEEAPRSVTY
jgi:hypothetical protein